MKIIEELAGAGSVGISGHVRPDGDCVGSCLAMKQYLQKALPEARIDCYLEPPADIFACIKGFDEILHEADDAAVYDAFIVLDSVPERIGFARTMYLHAKKKINIDHHISNPGGADADHIVADASSTSELVYDVIDHGALDEDIAKAVYIGIIHDTGVLQYSNTSPKTLRTVAELICFGFDFPQIIDRTFYEKTFVQNQLLGQALLDGRLLLSGRCAASFVTLETLQAYHADGKDLEGIVNQLRYTKGADCAIFLYEIKKGTYKVSLRSNHKLDVSKVAAVFGGGGHIRAAGCTMEGCREEIYGKLTDEIKKQL